MENKIQIGIAELEILLNQYKQKITENIVNNIGSYDTIQKLRQGKDLSNNWQNEENKLKKDIEHLSKNTDYPLDFQILKKYLV